MRATKALPRLKAINRAMRNASPGERIFTSLMPARGSGYPGFWGAERIEQVHHFKNWAFVYIDTIACKIASIFPNLAAVVDQPQPGRTVKAGQRGLASLLGRGFGSRMPYVGQQLQLLSDWDHKKATQVAGMYVGTEGWERPTLYEVRGNEVRITQDGNPTPVGFSGGGHAWLTQGEYRSKALSVVQEHEELEPLEADHPLRRLMENPNPVDTFFDVEYELQMFEELCGISYEWTPKNKLGQPCERWCIPSHWVYPRTGPGQYAPYNAEFAENLVWDYEIRPWGYPGYSGILHFPPDEVVVTRWKSPLSKLDGHSKLRAGAMWVDEEEGISTSRWSQMHNRGGAESVIELGPGYEDPDEATIARIEAKFVQRVQGPFNFGKPIIMPPGAKMSPFSFSPAEMAYFESEKQIQQMLGSLFRVPGAAVGITESMTYGSVMATLGALCVFCLNPRLVMRGQNRTKHLASCFDETVPAWSQSGKQGRASGGSSYTRRIKLWYDDCVPADPQQVNADVQLDFTMGTITQNEARALRGRAPFRHGGDDPLIQGPGGLMPMPVNTGKGLDDLAALIAPMADVGGVESGEAQAVSDLEQDPAADASTPAAAPRAEVPKLLTYKADSIVQYFSFVGSYDGAVKIRGRWVRAVGLNRIDKTGWDRLSGVIPAAALRAAREQPPTEAVELFPELARFKQKSLVDVYPDVRQDTNFRCGAAEFAAACRYRGIAITIDKAAKILGTNVERSTSPEAMLREFAKLGVKATAKAGLTLRGLAAAVAAGDPVICPIQDYGSRREAGASFAYGHWVTVLSVGDAVLCHDPSLENVEREPGGDVRHGEPSGSTAAPGIVAFKKADWLKIWHDKREDGTKLIRFGIRVGERTVPSKRAKNTVKGRHYKRPAGSLEEQMAYTSDYDRGSLDALLQKKPPMSPSQGYKDGYADGFEDIAIVDEAMRQSTEAMFRRWGMQKGIAFDTVAAAGKWLAGRWQALEGRYGRKTALAMAAAMLATSPLPGNIAAVIAAAEAVRGIQGYFARELGGVIQKSAPDRKTFRADLLFAVKRNYGNDYTEAQLFSEFKLLVESILAWEQPADRERIKQQLKEYVADLFDKARKRDASK